MLSAWLGGMWAGILTTAICAVAAEYYWIAPAGSWQVENASQLVALIVFAAVGIVISALNEWWHEAVRALVASEARRQKAESAMREANRQKDEFLAMVSHELRTPMNGILGWASMLRSGRIEDARRDRAVNGIYNNAQRQAQLIEELLDVSRIMSGKFRLVTAPISLDDLVRDAVDSLQSSADAKQIDLSVDIEPVEPLQGDALRLQQVVSNLVSNAIKFTPEHGKVSVRLSRTVDAIELAVSDNGEGIRSTFLPFVFEPFRQADPSDARPHGGLGLGLAIVRQIVEAHHGTVRAESRGEGKGATFTVRLPAAQTYVVN